MFIIIIQKSVITGHAGKICRDMRGDILHFTRDSEEFELSEFELAGECAVYTEDPGDEVGDYCTYLLFLRQVIGDVLTICLAIKTRRS